MSHVEVAQLASTGFHIFLHCFDDVIIITLQRQKKHLSENSSITARQPESPTVNVLPLCFCLQ